MFYAFRIVIDLSLPQFREIDTKVFGENPVEKWVDYGVQLSGGEGPDEMMRSQEEIGVVVGSLAVHVNQYHHNSDWKPHHEHGHHVQQ